MKPRRKDADEQSGQKYQMHDSYLITEISQYQHINAVNSLRPIVAWRWCRARGGFLHGSRRHRAAAAVAVVEEEEREEEGDEEEEEGGMSRKKAVARQRLEDSSSMRTNMSFLHHPGSQEACAGDLKGM